MVLTGFCLPGKVDQNVTRVFFHIIITLKDVLKIYSGTECHINQGPYALTFKFKLKYKFKLILV